jgi:hypothetical protein
MEVCRCISCTYNYCTSNIVTLQGQRAVFPAEIAYLAAESRMQRQHVCDVLVVLTGILRSRGTPQADHRCAAVSALAK